MAKRRSVSTAIGRVRRSEYRSASLLGDMQAVVRSAETGSVAPIGRRMVRKWLWRSAGRRRSW